MLSIQSRPVFTISIGDMHIDEKDDLTWTCEAFGIPDVKYEWLKNSVPISGIGAQLNEEEQKAYEIRDNVLIIRGVQKDRDKGMYQCKAYNELDTRYVIITYIGTEYFLKSLLNLYPSVISRNFSYGKYFRLKIECVQKDL